MRLAFATIAVIAALDVAHAITTTLEYEDARETLTRAAVSNDVAQAVTNLDARPVPLTPQTSGRGVTFIDQYGEDQNVAVSIGAGAQAAVTTNAVEAAADNKVIRSTGVAIGGHASVTNPADPLKIQGVAVGWHATVSAINGVAVGGGANHPGDDNATTASAPKAIAIGYNAKASAANAVQLGEGVNTEEDTLKFRDVTIVKDGKIQGSIDEDQLLADGFAKLSIVEETNGVKRVTIENDDCTFRVVTDTNRADGVALTMGDAEIYGTAAIDRKLADKADITRLGLPVGTTQDVWVCNWSGEILPFRIQSGPALTWQQAYGTTPALIYMLTNGRWQLNTQGSTVLTVAAAGTAAALDFGNGFTLARKCYHPVAYTDDIPVVYDWAKASSKPSYTAAEVGATTPEDVTVMIRDQSLGGIWDQDLEVWWTPVMRNGSLTYQATTNVNLNAEH